MTDQKQPRREGWTIFRKSDDEVFGRGVDCRKIDFDTLSLIGFDALPDSRFDKNVELARRFRDAFLEGV